MLLLFVVILGDTSNPKAALKLTNNVDVLIHECTYPDDRITRARQNGHSTPKLISQFVNLIGAKHLVVNHVGARFDNQVEELRVRYFFSRFHNNNLISVKNNN